MKLSTEQQDIKYKWYLKAFGEAKSWAEKLSQGEDKLILTISSGTLVLSITFINVIVTSYGLQYMTYLKWSWVLLVTTIILNLMSIWCALRGTHSYIKKLNEWIETNEIYAPVADNRYSKFTIWLSNTSYITLIIGIILMTSFFWFNVNSLILLK